MKLLESTNEDQGEFNTAKLKKILARALSLKMRNNQH